MARMSFEWQVREMLKDSKFAGVEINCEDEGMGHDEIANIEVWSINAHMGEAGNAGCHTFWTHERTWPKAWKAVRDYLNYELVDCESDCSCY